LGVVETTPRLSWFPVLAPPGWKATERAVKSDGSVCQNDAGHSYTQAGRAFPPERPILYDSFDELRHGVRHGAMDIMAARGAPVVAPVDGVVPVTVRWKGASYPGQGVSANGGNYVYIQGVDGWQHYFAHMRNVRVRPGQKVVAGQQIGEVSDTGDAAGGCTHLHYATELSDGTKFNQYQLLKQLYDAGLWQGSPVGTLPSWVWSTVATVTVGSVAIAGMWWWNRRRGRNA
jgi:murein DD-endopeptidase MepM/ murein hydrolase activator NlpD